MRHFLIIAIATVILFFVFICRVFAGPLPWDNWELGLLGGIVAVNGIDAYQTHVLTVQRDDDYEEVNAYTRGVFGERVTWYESIAGKIAVFGPLLYFGAHKWSDNHKIRKLLLACLFIVAMEPVINNERVSGGLVFNF